MAASLLDRIDAEAIHGDLKKALRLCPQLGGVTGSERLREWAAWELDGYKGKGTINSSVPVSPICETALDRHYSACKSSGRQGILTA